jgi:hypothetical protein
MVFSNIQAITDGVTLSAIMSFNSPKTIKSISQEFANAIRRGVTFSEKPYTETIKESYAHVRPIISKRSGRFEIVLPYLKVQEGYLLVMKSLDVIEKIGYTDEFCDMTINIKSKNDANEYSLLEFVYAMGETPKSINSGISQSSVAGCKIFHNNPYIISIDNQNIRSLKSNGFFIKSNQESIYSVKEGSYFINCIGGRNYQKEKKGIASVMERAIHSTVGSKINESDMTLRMSNMLSAFKLSIDGTRGLWEMMTAFPGIRMYNDMKPIVMTNKNVFDRIREKMLDLVYGCEVYECTVNYDSDAGAIQIKDAKFKKGSYISGVDLINCKGTGCFENVRILGCEFKRSIISKSKILIGNEISRSSIYESNVTTPDNEFSNCVIKCAECIVTGKIRSSLVTGRIGEDCEMDKLCELLN